MDEEAADERLRDIYWLERAAEDLYRIVSHLEETSPKQAEQVYRAVHDTATNLAYFPRKGPARRWCRGSPPSCPPGTWKWTSGSKSWP